MISAAMRKGETAGGRRLRLLTLVLVLVSDFGHILECGIVLPLFGLALDLK